MLYSVSRDTIAHVLVAIMLRNEAARRRRVLQSAIEDVKRRMARRSDAAKARFLMMVAEGDCYRTRRVVERAMGKWRGSTISGYLRCDEQTYESNFRMNRDTFDKLLGLLQSTEFVKKDEAKHARPRRSKQRRSADSAAFARAHTDPPSTRFKLAVCLYAMAQGGRFKLIGDAASVDKSTVRVWMSVFCMAVMRAVKPVYMPGKPFSPYERSAVQGKFASRRGFPDVTLACDGSHIPFYPCGDKKVKMQYRNYKGWTSLLAVAFVDSYYRFFDLG